MAELMAEKQRVDLRNKVLDHLLSLTNAQVSDTRAYQVAQHNRFFFGISGAMQSADGLQSR